MRRWFDFDNLSWRSDDGYEIILSSDIHSYILYDPNGWCIGAFSCDDLYKQIGDLDIKLYEYMFYKAERVITVIDITLEKALNKLVCNRDYSIKHRMNSDKHCFNCSHLLFKDYRHSEGTCGYTHRFKSFYDKCDHKEE